MPTESHQAKERWTTRGSSSVTDAPLRPQLISEFPPSAESNASYEQLTAGPPTLEKDSSTPGNQLIYQPWVLVAVAMSSGIFVDRFLPLSFGYEWVGAAVLLVSWSFLQRSHRFGNSRVLSCVLLAAIALLAAAWHHGYWNWYGAQDIARFARDRVTPCALEVTLCSEAREVAASQNRAGEMEPETRYAVQVNRLRDGDHWRELTGNAELVVHGACSPLSAGDQVRVFGKLVGISEPTNPGQFDFSNYYRTKRNLAFVHVYQADSLVPLASSTSGLTTVRSSLRSACNHLLRKFIGAAQYPFAAAVLLGNREQIPQDQRDRFVESGTVHLLAISGLHVGILAGLFLLLVRVGFLRRKASIWLTIVFVVFYAWLVEFRPPATRASILIVLLCVGRLLGERGFSMNLLSGAAAIVLAINPTDLFSVGPQLSFLAVATLSLGAEWIFWAPSDDPLDRLIASTRSSLVRWLNWVGRQVRALFLVSLAIWLVALPLVAYHFHLVSFAGLVINPIMLLPVALGLYAALMILVTGSWLTPAASLLGAVCFCCFAVANWMVDSAHQWSWSHDWVVGPSLWAVILFYIGFLLLVAFPPTRIPLPRLAVCYLAWMVCAWWIPNQPFGGDDSLRCTFVDVGHGTCILVEQPDGKNWLYDAGALNSSPFVSRNVNYLLWARGIEKLDAIVLSHADVDHFNAVPGIMKKFHVREIVMTPGMADSDAKSVAGLLEKLAELGIPIRQCSAGDRLFQQESVIIDVLGPPEGGIGDSDNANSLVLRLAFEGRTILLPGDLEGRGLSRLMDQEKQHFDVMMAPHHGSPNSDPKVFAKWAKPQFVVISSGTLRDEAGDYFYSQSSVRKVFQTKRDGAVRCTVKKSGLQWETWDQTRWTTIQ